MDVVLPDAETLVGRFLRARLDPIPVATKRPNPRPETFVRAWRTGGQASSRVRDVAVITCEAWAADTVEAHALALRVRDLLLAAASSDGIALARGVYSVSGPYADPDPDSGNPRYSLTVQVVLRAARTTT